MRQTTWLLSMIALFSLATLAAAKDKGHLPLPPEVMSAKTVYIVNRSGQAALADRAYQEIKSWGRLEVVQDQNQADLIFLLTLREEVTGASNTGKVDEKGNISTTTSSNELSYSGLTVLDAKTGNSLWTESKVASMLRKSAVKRAIDELRKRIEEQSSEPKTH